jgi:hypothetical protein
MPSSRLLAFAVDWWIDYRDVDPVRRAFRLTDVQYWHPLIQDVLESNKKLRCNPSSWLELAERLRRDPTTIFKNVRAGTSQLSYFDLRSIATILNLPPTALWMSDRDRISKAAHTLCSGEANPHETMAYYLYREARPAVEDSQLDPRGLREVIRIMQQISTVQNAEYLIWKVAQCLEPKLVEAMKKSLIKRERVGSVPGP